VVLPTRAFSAWAGSKDRPVESFSLGPNFSWVVLHPGETPECLPFSFSKTDAIFLRALGFAVAVYTVGVASLLQVERIY